MTAQRSALTTRRYTFNDCLHGAFEHPAGRIESLVFDILFVIGMATTMVLAINLGVRPFILGEGGTLTEDLKSALFMLPEMALAALAARILYADRVSNWALKHLILPHFKGLAASFLAVASNVILMAPAMCACAVLVNGAPPAAILNAFGTVLPYAMLAGFTLSMAVIRPLVMMAFSNLIAPRVRAWRRSHLIR